MNEEYRCNCCKRGKIRPIQFSLKQAIINCDNIECDSYLEKWPWECIVTRPLLPSSSLCKYERDSVCSSDSSGVHSDLGSSGGFSQSSVTDKEVESLLQKSYPSITYSQANLIKENSRKWVSPWLSTHTHTNREPFVALDSNSSSPSEPPSDENITFESVLKSSFKKTGSTAATHPTSKLRKGENEFLEMLKDFNIEDISSQTFFNPPRPKLFKEEVHDDTLNAELESWIEGFEEFSFMESVNKENRETPLNVSSSKTLIPSVRSAFSEVSPSKIEVNLRKKGASDSSPSNYVLPNFLTNDSNFLSPASSGFSEDNSANEDNSVHLYKPALSSFPTTFKSEDDLSSCSKTSSSKHTTDNKTILKEHSHAETSANKCLDFSTSESCSIVLSSVPQNEKSDGDVNSLNDEKYSDNQIMETLNMLELLHESTDANPLFSSPENYTYLNDKTAEKIIKSEASSSSSPINFPIESAPNNPGICLHEIKPNKHEVHYEKKSNSEELLAVEAHNLKIANCVNSTLEKSIKLEKRSTPDSVNEVSNTDSSQDNLALSQSCTNYNDLGFLPITSSICDIKLERNEAFISNSSTCSSFIPHESSSLLLENEAKKPSISYQEDPTSLDSSYPSQHFSFENTLLNLQPEPESSMMNIHPKNTISPLNASLPHSCQELETPTSIEDAQFTSGNPNYFPPMEEHPYKHSQQNSAEHYVTVISEPTPSMNQHCSQLPPSPPPPLISTKLEHSSSPELDFTDGETPMQLDFSPDPKWNFGNNKRFTRSKLFKGGFEVDPWSIPEVYINELNIEVILKDPATPSTPDCACLSASHTVDEVASSAIPNTSINWSSTSTISVSPLAKNTNVSCPVVPSTTIASPPPCGNEIKGSSQSESSVVNEVPSPQKVNVYKPITLRPEVLEVENYHDSTLPCPNFNYSRPPKPRLSVGYLADSCSSGSSETVDESLNELNRSSSYFNTVFSNLNFDQNFCLNSIEESERELAKPGDSAKEDQVNASMNEEESDMDIPIVTIDSDDELNIFIPMKKNLKRELDEKDHEDDFVLKKSSRNYISHQPKNHYPRKRQRLAPAYEINDNQFMSSTPAQSKNPATYFCSSYDKLFPHTNSALSNGNSKRNSTNIEYVGPLDPFVYNVSSRYYNFINKDANFGDLKTPPHSLNDPSSLETREDARLSLVFNNQETALEERLWGVLPAIHTLESFEEEFSSKGNKSGKRQKGAGNHKPLKTLAGHSYMNSSLEGAENDEEQIKSIYKNNVHTIKNNKKKCSSNFRTPKKVKRNNNHRPKTLTNIDQSASTLGPNPSVPEVLKLLKDSGWAVTPCNPVINYEIPSHAKSPTVIPAPLKDQYGNTGSDVVLWTLTDDKELVHSNQEPIKSSSVGAATCTIPVPKIEKTEFHLPKLKDKGFYKDKTNRFFSGRSTLKSTFGNEFPTKPPALKRPIKQEQELTKDDIVGLKTLMTSKGSLYVRPSFIKKESTATPPPSHEQSQPKESDGNGSSSDEAIELPDDFVAYETVVQEGYDVSAPATLPKCLFIPPASPSHKSKPKFVFKKQTKENQKPPPPPPPPVPVADPSQLKAQQQLTAIVSQRPANEVPDVVCMNVDGKLYLYHRKDS